MFRSGLLFIVAMVAAPVSASFAGTPAECKAYAERATTAQSFNIDCGERFKGPRWSVHFMQHYQWCLAVSPNEASRETQFRDTELKECTAKLNACSNYATEAVQQFKEATEALRCGFSGTRWSNKWGDHRYWCIKVAAGDRESERAIRARMLRECRAIRR